MNQLKKTTKRLNKMNSININIYIDELEIPAGNALALPFFLEEVELEIKYYFYGKNKQATYFEPAEYEDIEIEKINAISVFQGKSRFEINEKQDKILVDLIENDSYCLTQINDLILNFLKIQELSDQYDYYNYYNPHENF
jgi:hypothetical protein